MGGLQESQADILEEEQERGQDNWSSLFMTISETSPFQFLCEVLLLQSGPGNKTIALVYLPHTFIHNCFSTGEGRAGLGSDSSHSVADIVNTSVSSLHFSNQSTPKLSPGLASKGFFEEHGGVFKWRGKSESEAMGRDTTVS